MRILLLFPLLITLTFACVDKDKEKIAQLENQLNETSAKLEARDSAVNGYLNFLVEIEKNLNEIRKREAMISLNREDYDVENKEVRNNMIKDLQIINTLMKENKEKIAVLSRNLNGSKSELRQLHDLVSQLKKNIELKENEVTKLNMQLSFLTEANQLLKNQVDSLSEETLAKEETIYKQSEELDSLGNRLNMAYYATGSVDELKEKNIIQKEGGLLGIGSVKQLNENLNLDKLTSLDIRKTFSIPVNSRKVELITDHPLDSYELIMDEESREINKLLILDPNKFWASSKCVVLVTK